ncbi:MAG: aminotransferase class I/II-fold pyridoxal phosphate-dependent enzyme [Pirellulales bacterium]|nr:aminotransferase class I/II-fold pyridoxal phosphate-dependent enzyme [Pirellulales bacterium]
MPTMHSPPGPFTVIDGRRYLYFGGTGYLGLQGHPEVIRAACEAAGQYGIGSATSRAGCGETPPLLDAERRAAEFFAAADSFYFMSGYAGNSILVLALREEFDAVFVDDRAHYCVGEAARLAGRPIATFRHCDPDDLARVLREQLPAGARPLVLSDGVFPSHGEIAPAAQYAEVLSEYVGSILALDDAHAVAVLGANGRGTFEHVGLYDRGVNVDGVRDVKEDDVKGDSPIFAETKIGTVPGAKMGTVPPRLLACGTLSKAVGGYGGIIAGGREFVHRLKATSTYFNGASAVPVPIAAATTRALELILKQPELRARLWENVAAVKSGLRALGLAVDDSPVPIVGLVLGDADHMRRIHEALRAREIYLPYRSGYAGLGEAGALRLAVFATHTREMIDRLLAELAAVL